MRFKNGPQLHGAGRTVAGHHHGSHTPTSPGTVLQGKMANHTKQICRQCTPCRPDQLSIPFNNLPYFSSRFVNEGAAAVAVLDLDTSRANKLIEAVGAMTTTKSAASETKSKVKLCFSFVVSWAFFNYVNQILRIIDPPSIFC